MEMDSPTVEDEPRERGCAERSDDCRGCSLPPFRCVASLSRTHRFADLVRVFQRIQGLTGTEIDAVATEKVL